MLEVVSAIIEDDQGLVLLAQRPPAKKFAGLWEFPGGKVEANEGYEQALLRELQEELQLSVEIVQRLGVYPHSYDWGDIVLYVYVVRALGAPAPTQDVQCFEWLDPAKIDEAILVDADRPALVDYLKLKRIQI